MCSLRKMSVREIEFSPDQAEAFDRISAVLKSAGVDLEGDVLFPKTASRASMTALVGKAGSGKTRLLAELYKVLDNVGLELIVGDYEPRKKREKRSLAILAPTNKAASVLRMQGVPATTIHRILYTPVYDPEYEQLAEWLIGQGEKPDIAGLSVGALTRAFAFYLEHKSIAGALAVAGLRGSDFITGWKRREDPLDIAFLDEASMLDDKQCEDLQEIFSTIVMFGDPAQLAPVNQSGAMVFDRLKPAQVIHLKRIHRQSGDSPISDLAYALGDPEVTFDDFEAQIQEIAKTDERVQWAQRVEVDLMARSPVLVWRNVTRIRLIHAFRSVHKAPAKELLPGEPLICDGIELPMKHRKKRLDLEARGLIKGAQVVYLGPGKRVGFSRLHVIGAEEANLSAASIIKIEKPDEEQPFIPYAASMGAAFLHGAAVTIHKAQGSQWETVQVFAPDIFAAARTGRNEAGQQLWKRLAYVAITRAQSRLLWVVRNRLSKPTLPLSADDLAHPAVLQNNPGEPK